MQITKATSNNFPVGSKVKIINTGHTYSTYRGMAEYLGIIDQWVWGANPFENGDVGVVLARATHESERYGEVFAIKVGDKVAMLGAKGLVEYEEPIVIGKPKLAQYDLAPLTPDAYGELSKHLDKAPSWATHVGSDEYGVHFFDHQPHKYSRNSFVKGLLPDSHRVKMTNDCVGATQELKVMVLGTPVVSELDQLKAELAAVKAKLWEAEWKLNKIVETAQNSIK